MADVEAIAVTRPQAHSPTTATAAASMETIPSHGHMARRQAVGITAGHLHPCQHPSTARAYQGHVVFNGSTKSEVLAIPCIFIYE